MKAERESRPKKRKSIAQKIIFEKLFILFSITFCKKLKVEPRPIVKIAEIGKEYLKFPIGITKE
jgi:hypothetical protein